MITRRVFASLLSVASAAPRAAAAVVDDLAKTAVLPASIPCVPVEDLVGDAVSYVKEAAHEAFVPHDSPFRALFAAAGRRHQIETNLADRIRAMGGSYDPDIAAMRGIWSESYMAHKQRERMLGEEAVRNEFHIRLYGGDAEMF